jgi:hypothetical protein
MTAVPQEALDAVLIGGNHLAVHIGMDHPPHTATHEEAMKFYRPGWSLDAWCCWKAIMELRDAMGR